MMQAASTLSLAPPKHAVPVEQSHNNSAAFASTIGKHAPVAMSLILAFANTTQDVKAKPISIDSAWNKTVHSFGEQIQNPYLLSDVTLLDGLITRVRELAMLENGWYRSDSLAAAPQAIEDAERFLRKHDLQNLVPPIISLSEDGEINFVWRTERLYLDLGFFGDGTYTYYGKSVSGQVFMGDNAPRSASLPHDLTALLDIRA